MSQPKVYLEIVQKIRDIMETDGLKAGDRLPSERELSSRLHVGRSSVREALRALELVGLIETRRGEGTFVKNFYENGLVQLIATFVLQDEKTKKDLLQTKIILEQDMLRILCQSAGSERLNGLRALLNEPKSPLLAFHNTFFHEAAQAIDNYLLYRIWSIVTEYASALACALHLEDEARYDELYEAVQNKEEEKALQLYRQIAEHIVFRT